jgi:hypothetical protein
MAQNQIIQAVIEIEELAGNNSIYYSWDHCLSKGFSQSSSKFLCGAAACLVVDH